MSNNFAGEECPQIDVMISIGGACRTRYQIEHFMSKINPNYANIQVGSNYFDWLMAGGVTGAINVISRGFEISPSHIKLGQIGDKFIPRDSFSNHFFLHDFGESWGNDNYENSKIELNKYMESTIEKYKYLGKKTNALLNSNQSVALVYHGYAASDQWSQLKQTLFDCYHKEIPVINILEKNQKESVIAGIYTAFVDDEHSPKIGLPSEWTGWDESWFSAFSSLGCFTKP